MKKKLHSIFTLVLIFFASANLFAQLSLNIIKSDTNCLLKSGFIIVNPSSGDFPYTYSWSNGSNSSVIAGLDPGTYNVTVTDANGQTAYQSITINFSANSNTLKAIAVQTNASCNGAASGSATVAVKGGLNNYQYRWNTVPEQTTQSVTGLAAGTYTVMVGDLSSNSCGSTTFTIDLDPTSPMGDPTDYGDNSWNVYAWNEGTFNGKAWSDTYSGYFTANTLDFNSEDYFEDYNTPSSVPGYQGCKVNGDNHSWSAKREGFPCGYYKIDIPIHDDWIRLYIDDILVYQDDNCCESHTDVWQGYLNSKSKVEFRIAEEAGQSRGHIKFNLAEPTAVIGNVTCNGGNNGTINLPFTNNSYTYDWGNGITTKDRTGLSAGDYTVIITSSTGCTETKTYTVSQPNALIITPSQTNVSCNSGANGTATANVTGGTGAYTYSWAPSGATAATAIGLSAGTYTVTVTDANSCSVTQSFTISEPNILAVTPSQTNVLCNGAATGSASVVVTGGVGAYTYSWAPTGGTAATATGLTAGTYIVIITDANSCQTTQSFTITEPNALVVTPIAQTNIACFDSATGSASVNATGGTGAYTYSWAPSGGTAATASGLTAGVYTVTVTDANLCPAFQSFVLTQPITALTATSGGQTDVSCNGGTNGTATVNVIGGTGAYTYSWAPSGGTAATASGLSAGTFVVTVTDDNGCTATQSFTITEPAILSATTLQTDVSCNGGTNGTATVNVTGGTGAYTYSWTPSGGTAATATDLAAGTYTVTIHDDNTCQTTATVTIDQPAALSVTPSKTDVLCNGTATGTATVTVSGGTQGYTYLWTPSVSNGPTATGLTVGQYSCKVIDANGCTITQNFTIFEPSVLTATSSQINATCVSPGQASVSPSGGVTPYTYLWTPSGNTTATATGLATGSNNVLITDANGCTITKAFTISTTNTLIAATSQADILCNGSNTGYASVIPSGAPGPFTYVWAPAGGNADTATRLTAGNYSVTITSSNGCSIVKNFTIHEPSPIVVTPSQTNVSCSSGANGTATVNVTGGTGAYTYSWAPSGGTAATATGLSAGNYTATITDVNGCSATETFTITEPAILSATTSQKDVSCNRGANGTATVSVTGGTGVYTYSWAPFGGTAATATGLTAGTYTVTTTDANSCQLNSTFTILEPVVLSVTAVQTDITCNGLKNGTATVTATGGTLPYTYSWTPSGGTAATASGLSAGTYTATITDANGCTTTQAVTIAEPSLLTVTPSQTNVSCNSGANGTATVNVTGGTGGYTYSWAPSGGTAATTRGLSAGTFTVTVTDVNGCMATQSFIITEPAILSATTSQKDVSCSGGANGTATVSVTGGTGAYTYFWAPFGGTDATATDLTAGTYTVTITDANSCSITKIVTITAPENPVALSTMNASNVTDSDANLSGTAASDGINRDKGECLTEVGFVYATHTNPTITDIKINTGNTLGSLASSLTGLKGNTTYYVKTYAVNSNGYVNYGNEVSFTTEKYKLYITAAAGLTKVYGTLDPVFNFTVTGFANGDTNSILTGNLSRDAGENVGKYDIKTGTISAGANYIIVFAGASFEITKADQTITWTQNLDFGCDTGNTAQFTSTSNSGLPITYSIANSTIGEIDGTTLNIKSSGNSTIMAVQNGDQNYNAATSITKPIVVSQSGLITQQWNDVLLADNKSKNFVSWQWYKNGAAISGAARQYYSENQALSGSYYVIAVDKDGNSIKSCPLVLTGASYSKTVKVYPNPVKPSSEFVLDCDFSESQLSGATITIFNLLGIQMQTVSNVKAKNQLTAPSQSGVYIVLLTLSNGQQKTINVLVI